ncbi:hypothetical protein SAMN05660350_01004 [Geodermatophilus obscurus]|uniref:DUF3040 domain-containing protein n=1 Tax=Geodermatophilus obscurus TaxID=1861 RepID=A0A1M7SQZ3_9ACTN|nr:hypothetical protein [Geodermatophilus obscurus]SHN60798.1 hypothetical protein SAMN05660350_01004 [Geodermatophilus obscurus]
MFSRQELSVRDDVQRSWAAEVEEPPPAALPAPSRRTRVSRDPADLPVAVVTAAWITIMLLLFGAPVAGLVLAGATALGWALWHHRPQPGRQDAPKPPPDENGTARGPADERRHRRLRRTGDAG